MAVPVRNLDMGSMRARLTKFNACKSSLDSNSANKWLVELIAMRTQLTSLGQSEMDSMSVKERIELNDLAYNINLNISSLMPGDHVSPSL
jgi:hypothetical protein